VIHKFKLLGLNIVLDVYSGSILVVDDCVFDILQEDGISVPDGKYEADEIGRACREIEEMKSRGMLYCPDNFADAVPEKSSVIKAVCLHVAHDCNLRCEYCFAHTGSFAGERTLMDLSTGQAAIDFVIKNSGDRRNIEVDFFGGEPLMNLGAVRGIVAYARSIEKKYNKNFRFTITTNGMLLDDETARFINENMANVVLSLDGRERVNDRVRKTLSGGGCYDSVVGKFKDIADARGQDNYYIRGTFTAYNKDFSNDAAHLADLGFEQISIEPVVLDEGRRCAIKKEDLDDICLEYEKLLELYIKRGDFNFFHFMTDLSGGPCVQKRIRGCGAGCEYIAVTPDGDIFPCHQFVGREEFKMGSVYGGAVDADIREKFERTNVYTKEKCRGCFAKFYCSGGCMANAYNFSGDINIPHDTECVMQKKRIECAIALQCIRSQEEGGRES